jgi:CheY-like chemotaxis protein
MEGRIMSSNVKLKVLVVDDSTIVHGIFADMAEGSPIPFEVIRAHNGQQCMEFLKQGGINLAFIDVNMPGMSGVDAVSAARYEGIKTFVTLISSNPSKRRFQLARLLKVYEFLAKPFTAADVYAILRTYCKVNTPTRALIVDDSATVRRLINKVVSGSVFNFDVNEAADGEKALEACENGDYDVIVLDCNMPGLNGVETLERLIERDPGVKVIMMSGERNEERRRWALDRGAIAFLYKPFYPADIDRELHKLFDLKMPMLASAEDTEPAAMPASVGSKT